MFAFLEGTLIEKHPTVAVVAVDGIGYELLIPLSTYSKLPEVNQTVKVLTHLHVREDAWQLFGFWTVEEKELFKLLITISGIGPKLGLTILSGIGVTNFKQAVINKDNTTLTAVSGIGKKTAERIIVELKEKIKLDEETLGRLSPATAFSTEDALTEDSLTALISLGYKRHEAQAAVKKVIAKEGSDNLSVEKLIRKALTFM
ncbi:MAG: Holliday junction branch migration protein RuvA [Candidatus Omnitrophica bacterium]|nr:Holliday junction branch migration protein RuvA [Candidatus Omnitrophota bacterium]